MYTWIVTLSSLSLANHSHELQNSLRSVLVKDTTLNTNEPTSKFAKHDECPIVPFNFPTNHLPFEAEPNQQHYTADDDDNLIDGIKFSDY
jgi:hypothetical protein